MDAFDERVYEILRLILIDYAEQNIGPNANLPSSSIRCSGLQSKTSKPAISAIFERN